MLARVAGLGECPRALGLPRAFIIPPHRVRLGARRAPSWRVGALYSARLHPPLALSTRRAPLSVRRRAYPPSAAIVRPSARCSRRGHGLRHRQGLSAGGAHSGSGSMGGLRRPRSATLYHKMIHPCSNFPTANLVRIHIIYIFAPRPRPKSNSN